MFHRAIDTICLLTIMISCSMADKNSNSTLNPNSKLLLISFDGFRWNYLSRTKTPNFQWIKKNGVSAVHGLTNAFITKTFPNHYTLVTGQWEEDHGIIANYMYDPLLNETFSPHNMKAQHSSEWYDVGGEPIWVTNQKAGGRSGVVMWVGGGAPIKNILPTKYFPFDLVTKNETKIDTLIKWFKEDDINLGLIYFPQPDRFGHTYGPESIQVTHMIGGLDELVGYLLHRLKEEHLLGKINIIITSDHGFTATPKDKEIDLNAIVDSSTYSITSTTPIAGIWPKPDYHEEIFKNLSLASKKNGHFTVYLKENIPDHFHYKHSQRIPPIVIVADDHYSFRVASTSWHLKGNHGYDNRLQDMHPFFIAKGPAFRSGFEVDTFHSVDVYPLMCKILGLQPAPNNGSLQIVETLLLNSEGAAWVRFFQKNQIGTYIVAFLVACGIVVAMFIAVSEYRKKKKMNASRVMLDDAAEMVTEIDSRNQMASSTADNSRVPLLNDHDF